MTNHVLLSPPPVDLVTTRDYPAHPAPAGELSPEERRSVSQALTHGVLAALERLIATGHDPRVDGQEEGGAMANTGK